MSMTQPAPWRDTLTQYRIKREVINNDKSLTIKDKEEQINNEQ